MEITSRWKLKNTAFNNQGVKKNSKGKWENIFRKISMETQCIKTFAMQLKQCLEENLWLETAIFKKKRLKISNLTFLLKKLEKFLKKGNKND